MAVGLTMGVRLGPGPGVSLSLILSGDCEKESLCRTGVEGRVDLSGDPGPGEEEGIPSIKKPRSRTALGWRDCIRR